MNSETYKLIDDITRIGNRAVRKAQEENRQKGLPNVYELNDIIIYELPDGTVTSNYQID